MSVAEEQISRTSLGWLMLSQAVVVIPLQGVLPSWILILALVVWLWCVMILQSRLAYPSKWLKPVLVALPVIGLVLSFNNVGLELFVSALICFYLLKPLEIRTRTSATRLCILSLLMLVLVFLFIQNIFISIYGLCAVILIVAALVGLARQSSRPLQFGSASLGKSAVMVLQALPLALILFILVPGLPPLWSVPLPSHSAETGLTNKMTPGDIAQISQSDKLAFRATFSGTTPPRPDLYWRAVVMSDFDGRTWSEPEPAQLYRRYGVYPAEIELFSQRSSPWVKASSTNKTLSYQITVEPTGQPWLFSLSAPLQSSIPLRYNRDFTLQFDRPLFKRTRYKLASQPDTALDVILPEWLKSLNSRLPQTGNKRSRAFANEVWQRSGQQPEEYIHRILAYFQEQPFFYTLKPPLLGKDSIDDFLFNKRRGFCSHYASSFVFLMRVVGLPARVVGGYQGGELHPDGYVQVRQFDAHAWSEVWLPTRGWVRYDPTAFVAPLRVRQGLEEAVSNEDTFLSDSPWSVFKFKHVAWLNQFRLTWDWLEYRWQDLVLGYHKKWQMSFLEQLFGVITHLKLALIIALAVTAVLLPLAVILLWQKGRGDPVEAVFIRFCEQMKRKGWPRQKGEGVLAYGKRVSKENPSLAGQVQLLCRLYSRFQYGLQPAAESQAKRTRRYKRLLLRAYRRLSL